MPPAPAQQTTSKPLWDHLVAMAHTRDLNEFDLKHAEREARKLLQVDALQAHTALGAVAALRYEEHEVHTRHKTALNLSHRAPRALLNYAVSLRRIGRFDESREATLEALAQAPSDPALLQLSVTASVRSGHFLEAKRLQDDLMVPSTKRSIQPPVDPKPGLTELCAAIKRNLFSEHGLQQVIAIATETLRAHKMRLREATIIWSPVDPDEFMFEQTLWTDENTASDLSMELDDKLGKRPDLLSDPTEHFLQLFMGTPDDKRQPG